MGILSQAKFPGSTNCFASAPYDDEAWQSTASLLAEGGYAYINAATFDTNDYSQVCGVTTYGFTIPNTAVILGIELETNKYKGAGAAVDTLVAISRDYTIGMDLMTVNKADLVTPWPAVGTVFTYGSPSDLWGRTWTPADINNAKLVTYMVCQATADDTDVYIDYMKLIVYYEIINNYYFNRGLRRSRNPVTVGKDVGTSLKEWISAASFTQPTRKIVGTGGIDGTVGITAGTLWSGGGFQSAGTAEMTIGSAGTVSWNNTLGTAREIYFCNTAGTTKAMPTGVTPFKHYYTHTRGYSSTSFTFGTSPTGTAGTQINLTGTSGTHTLWIKDP